MSMLGNYIEKRWYVVKRDRIGYILTTILFDKDAINKNPLNFEKANNFRNILNKLHK